VPDARREVARVGEVLRAWEAQSGAPPKLVYPLRHRYSLAELSFRGLKNEDAAVAGVLASAAASTGVIFRLAMVSVEETGSAEETGYGRGRYGRRRDDAQAYEIVEVLDRSCTLDAWRRPDDTPEPMGPIPFDREELAPPEALDDDEPDEVLFHEATGNEGCSFERTYRRAALVLWPASRELEVLHQAGPEASFTVLERLLEGEPERARAMAELIVRGSSPPARRDPLEGGPRLPM
jgi:hypothetical protein